MATMYRESGGYTIQIVAADKRRRTIRLGDVATRTAERTLEKIERLNRTVKAGQPPDDESAKWLAKIGDDLHATLAKAGLTQLRRPVEKPPCPTLTEFLDQYRAGRGDVGESTRVTYTVNGNRLLAFFGADTRLDTINAARAEDFYCYLKEQGENGEPRYAQATTAKTIKMSRQMFDRAVRQGYIADNPFKGLKAGTEKNPERSFNVTRETTEKVIAACPDAEWRLIVALARYGGVRTPSELLTLTWPDFFWDQDRFRVHSPKTKKQGKGERIVPLFPELRPFLEDAYQVAPEGALYVISRYRGTNTNLRTQLLRIMAKAGVSPWPRLFQNLRASRETELSQRFPIQVVTKWLGNTPDVALHHYLSTTEDDYRRAASGADVVHLVRQNGAEPGRSQIEPARTEAKESAETPGDFDSVRVGSETFERGDDPAWTRTMVSRM